MKKTYALIHMLGYITDGQKEDAKAQGLEDNDMHMLGYLDSPQWVEASKVLTGASRSDLIDLAKKVDSVYGTDFHGDIVEAN
jgi:hypothetical protein